MNFILHKDFSDFSATDWNTLVEQSIADTPFSRYEYLSEWWKTLGGGEWMGMGGGGETSPMGETFNGAAEGLAPTGFGLCN